MEKAFAEHEARHRNAVLQDTWGHLFPKGFYYEGKIIIAYTIYGDITILNERIDIQGSPWWFQAINDFAYKASDKMKAGQVFEFDISVKIVENKGELSFQINTLKKRKIKLFS